MYRTRLLGAISACALLCVSATSHAAAVSGQGSWETTLQGRDLDGDPNTFEAYYDTVLDITWLADANYAKSSGYDTDGKMSWVNANAWAAGLDPYGSGITGWRLPTTAQPDTGCSIQNTRGSWGYNCTGSEMGDLFYTVLGNTAGLNTNPHPSTLSNTGPFSNVQAYWYWSSTGHAPSNGSDAWSFFTYDGWQENNRKSLDFYAWAVHSGDISASVVPVPAAVWLFGSGLLGLVGIGRQRRR